MSPWIELLIVLIVTPFLTIFWFWLDKQMHEFFMNRRLKTISIAAKILKHPTKE